MKRIEKPWGREEILEINDLYLVKKLTMRQGHRCSLQYHRVKRETLFVLSGRLRVDWGPAAERLESRVLEPGDDLTLVPGVVHRMEAVTESVYLEASTPELDDVVRLVDDYQRAAP